MGSAPVHDYTDPGKPAIARDDLAARDALVTDARRLLTRLEVGADDPRPRRRWRSWRWSLLSARTRSGPPVEEAPIRWVCSGSVLSGTQFDAYADESRGGGVDLDLVVAAERVDLK